jgi:hypothetical protein
MNRKVLTILLNSFVILSTLLMQVFTVIGVTPAYAATLTVQSNADGAATPANCPGASCTLRDAIAAAASDDTITFDASLSGGTITLTSGELVIDKNLTIDGSALASQVTISGNNASRVFKITGAYNVTLNSLTIANGNSAGSVGSGILQMGGTLTVTNSTISGNISGGGIVNYGTLTVTNSTISGNSRDSGAGGGMLNAGTATVTNSAISGNTGSYGGGAANYGTTLTFINSTLSGNNAIGGVGAGIENHSGTLNLFNTIIANSSNSDDCRNNGGAIGSATNNLLEGTGVLACGLTDGSNGNIIGSDPLLSALGSYGGSTQIFALLPGSPAIDAGDATTCAGLPGGDKDQRGISRIFTCDIGSFESRYFVIGITGGNSQSATGNTAFTNPLEVTLTSSYGEPVEGGQVTFTPPVSGASAVITGSPATINASGIASVTAAANGTAGDYYVTASAAGAPSPVFSLTNDAMVATYTVTYDVNGATGGAAPANQTKTQDVDLTLATNSGSLVKTGYIFFGWNTQADGNGTHYAVGGTYTANAAVTLYAEWVDVTADGVFGQGGVFNTNIANKGGISAESLNNPMAFAIDSNGGVYVAEYSNHRVLYYPAGSATATRVYGQGGSFTTNTANKGGISADSLSNPSGVTLDGGGVYIVDTGNNRVLYYPADSTTATRVYGQGGSFTTGTDGISATSMLFPQRVAIDAGGVYITEWGNNRVMYYAGTSTSNSQYENLFEKNSH